MDGYETHPANTGKMKVFILKHLNYYNLILMGFFYTFFTVQATPKGLNFSFFKRIIIFFTLCL